MAQIGGEVSLITHFVVIPGVNIRKPVLSVIALLRKFRHV